MQCRLVRASRAAVHLPAGLERAPQEGNLGATSGRLREPSSLGRGASSEERSDALRSERARNLVGWKGRDRGREPFPPWSPAAHNSGSQRETPTGQLPPILCPALGLGRALRSVVRVTAKVRVIPQEKQSWVLLARGLGGGWSVGYGGTEGQGFCPPGLGSDGT